MTSRSAALLIGGVATIAAAGAGAYVVQQRNALNAGIAQTTQAIQNIDMLINQNQTDAVKLFAGLEIDFGGAIDPGIGHAIDLFKQAAAGYQAANGAVTRDYGQAIGNTAEAIANVWALLNPQVAIGKALIDVGAEVYEAQAILLQQAQLIETRALLQDQLFRLEGKDPERQAEWESLLNKLHGDAATAHAAFERWLAENNVAQQQLLASSLRQATAVSCAAGDQIARGVTIVDPAQGVNNLATIKGINPAFVQAMREQAALLSRGDIVSVQTAGAISHAGRGPSYYIPVFQPSVLREVHPRAQSDPTCLGGSSAPKAVAGSVELDELAGKVARRLGFGCCLYSYDQGQKILAALRQEISSGHPVQVTNPRTRTSKQIGGDDLALCGKYEVNYTWTETYSGGQPPQTRAFGSEESLCPNGSGGLVWGHATTDDSEYAKCQNTVSRKSQDAYEGACESQFARDDRSVENRKWSAAIEVSADTIAGQEREERAWHASYGSGSSSLIKKFSGKMKYCTISAS